MATRVASTSAIVLRQPGEPAKLEQLKLGPLRADEALIEIHFTGVCHSDLVLLDGTLPAATPIVLGHEGMSRFVRSRHTHAEHEQQAQELSSKQVRRPRMSHLVTRSCYLSTTVGHASAVVQVIQLTAHRLRLSTCSVHGPIRPPLCRIVLGLQFTHISLDRARSHDTPSHRLQVWSRFHQRLI
jgi:hypothetical protein